VSLLEVHAPSLALRHLAQSRVGERNAAVARYRGKLASGDSATDTGWTPTETPPYVTAGGACHLGQ
jgi:hypothetical protein